MEFRLNFINIEFSEGSDFIPGSEVGKKLRKSED